MKRKLIHKIIRSKISDRVFYKKSVIEFFKFKPLLGAISRKVQVSDTHAIRHGVRVKKKKNHEKI